MKASPLLCLRFLTYKMEILLPFGVVIRIKKISVNMVNFKSCKHKVLLSLIPSSSMVLLLVFLLKNKTRSLNMLFPQYSYHFFLLSLFFNHQNCPKEAQVGMVEECRHHTVWVWRDSNETGQHNSQARDPEEGAGFRVPHGVHVLFLPLTHPGA